MSYIIATALIVPAGLIIWIVRNWSAWSEECDGVARRASEAKRNH